MELSPTDRAAAIAMLERRLTYRALRAVLEREERGRRRHKGVEWIIAEAEKDSRDRRLRSRLPDAALAPFLVDLKGADLLSSRELRRQLTAAADPTQLQDLHEFPSRLRGRRGHASMVNAVADRSWHPPPPGQPRRRGPPPTLPTPAQHAQPARRASTLVGSAETSHAENGHGLTREVLSIRHVPVQRHPGCQDDRHRLSNRPQTPN
jgi:hypothetical protein